MHRYERNPVRREFSCHIDIRRYFVRKLVKDNIVKLIPLRTHKMVADALTKSLLSPAFISHRKVMLRQVPFSLKCLGTRHTSVQCIYNWQSTDLDLYTCILAELHGSKFWGVIFWLLNVDNSTLCMGESDEPLEDTPTNKICHRVPRAAHEQDRITNEPDSLVTV